MRFELRQSTRVVLLLVDIGLLCGFSQLAFGAWLPPLGNDGFWFYTALLSLLLGSRLVTPFYHKPVDVIAYCVSALVALFLVNNWGQWADDVRLSFFLVAGYCGVICAAAFVQIFSKDSAQPWLQRVSGNLRTAVDILGGPRVIFSVVIWFAIYAFHRHSAQQLLWIAAAWAVTVAFSPLEGLLKLAKRLRFQWGPGTIPSVVGEVIAYQHPNIVLFRQTAGMDAPFGAPLMVRDKHSPALISIALDYVGRDQGMLRRAVEIVAANPSEDIVSSLDSLPDRVVARLERSELRCEDIRSKTIADEIDRLVGLVAPESSIDRLYFEVIKEGELEEGRLVQAFIGERPVIYQIVNGLTKEEIVYQKNTYGYARAQAQKIGVWDQESKRFELAKWLPALHTPVFLKAEEGSPRDADSIGHFPRTSYTVGIKNIHELVTHNAAILGILGVGKSMLSIELLERMMTEGIKVICLDLTNQYAIELAEFYDQNYELARADRITHAGEQDRDKWAEDPEQGGSLVAFSQAIYDDLAEFINPENPRKLKIYNPSQLFATKQLSEPKSYNVGGQWHRKASLWSVTPVEVTRVVSEAALTLLQGEITDQAKVCLVYEEAHSLVPEWNAVATEGDRAATNGTARAILQGRKYGLGCLLITQRTASVTKTILNQCNTVFAMRTFDETGKDFLANYVGREYSSSLSSLPERHAVFFGKASTCENPVLIRLNDRGEFKAMFRAKHPPPALPVETDGAEIASGDTRSVGEGNEFDDPIPF